MKLNKHTILTVLILLALVAGALLGEWLYRHYDGHPPAHILNLFSFIGKTVFIGLLKMLIVPLVASSIIVGVASLDAAHLGKVGGWTVTYYLSTMVIAIVLGLILVTSIVPGKAMDLDLLTQREAVYEQEPDHVLRRRAQQAEQRGLLGTIEQTVKQMIPGNIIAAAAQGQILAIIFFSLLLGIVLSFIGEQGRPVLLFFQALFYAIMKMVEWIIYLAPIGILFLLAWTVATIGAKQLLGPMLQFVITVIAGLLIHGLIVLPLVLWLFGRTHPFRFMYQMREALMAAFGTDSSAATLPVTMECATKQGGVSKRASGFVLPLGATVNMDGTALYEAVTVVFLFQCYGIALPTSALIIIVLTATLAAIGAAAVPSAGLVTMVIVIEAVNGVLPVGADGSQQLLPIAAVAMIWPIDRILDMCRTTVNVWGDAVGAKIITRIAPDPPS